jgi:hypothetical protein
MKMKERIIKCAQVLLAVAATLAMAAMAIPQPAMAGDVGAVVDLVLLPSSQTADVDGILDITIQAQCNGQDVSGIDAFIDFNPTYLEVQSVTPGTSLPTVLQNTYDNIAGKIDYSAGKLGSPFPSNTFTLATISFKVLDCVASTPVSFSTSSPRMTNVDFSGESKLDELFGATVTICVVNRWPVLSGGQVNPDPGYVTTDFTYSVTYTDADNDPPASPTVSIDGGGPIDMTAVNPGDTDYTDGKDYEYTTSGLAKGIAHTYQFAASDGTDDATGDTGTHDGPTVQNSPPVLSDGIVSPPSGNTTTDFTYSVTYTDADNDPPASPTVSIDGGVPIDMTEVDAGDTDYTDGKEYEYITSGLAKDVAHTYQFAASDGVDDATGDTGSHYGPSVQEGPPPAPVGGIAFTPNKLLLLAPWIGLVIAIMAGASLLALRRRRT